MIKNIVVIIAIISAVLNAGLVVWNVVDNDFLKAIFHLLSFMYMVYIIGMITEYAD